MLRSVKNTMESAKKDEPPHNLGRPEYIRTTIEGCWILDKSRENWSMNEYLKIMNVDPLAIEAHEKGEKEHDTFHTIELWQDRIKIIKRSRVNSDVVVDLVFGVESVEYLQPNNRPKSSIATLDHPGQVCIRSSLVTTDHGKAIVTDIKRLQRQDTTTTTNDSTVSADISNNNTSLAVSTHQRDMIVLVQELTILNEETGRAHTTTRCFLPYYDTPPHLVSPPRNMEEDADD
jgi:hypothetical protein